MDGKKKKNHQTIFSFQRYSDMLDMPFRDFEDRYFKIQPIKAYVKTTTEIPPGHGSDKTRKSSLHILEGFGGFCRMAAY